MIDWPTVRLATDYPSEFPNDTLFVHHYEIDTGYIHTLQHIDMLARQAMDRVDAATFTELVDGLRHPVVGYRTHREQVQMWRLWVERGNLYRTLSPATSSREDFDLWRRPRVSNEPCHVDYHKDQRLTGRWPLRVYLHAWLLRARAWLLK